MAHTHVLAKSARRRLAADLAPPAHGHAARIRGNDDAALSLAEAFQLWHLPPEQLRRPIPLRRAAQDTGQWHLQVLEDGQPRHTARAARTATGWHIVSVSTSLLAPRIAQAARWIDRNGRGDPLARVLVMPECQLAAIWFRRKATDRLYLLDVPAAVPALQVETVLDYQDLRRALLAALPPS